MDLIRWSTLAYTMSHDVVMLYAVVTLLYAVHSRSTHGVCIPTLCGVMDARSHRSHGSPHYQIMDHGDVVDHVLRLDVPWMVLPSPWLLVFVGIVDTTVCCALLWPWPYSCMLWDTSWLSRVVTLEYHGCSSTRSGLRCHDT